MARHPSLTQERLLQAVERETFGLDNPGFCTACGEEQDGCEPDARNYECDNCGARKVSSPHVLLGII